MKEREGKWVTKLGDFWKFLVKWFLSKVAQMRGKLLGKSEKQQLLWLLFGQLLEKLGYFLIYIWSLWLWKSEGETARGFVESKP